MNPYSRLSRDYRHSYVLWDRVIGLIIIFVGVPLAWFSLIEGVRWLWAHL